jgi:ElaB/YqjD/DUF883 family membrane-anchored ribosome-binding protein
MMDDNRSADEAAPGAPGEADRAAETASDRISDGKPVKQILEGVLNFVQEQPWVAVAGAFVLGYMAAQLVKRTK